MEDGSGGTKHLSEVVKECVSRWFQETLEEAKAGDIRMRELVTQMYFNGYGVSKNPQKGKFWMKKVSKYLSSVQAVSEKRPGYGASVNFGDWNVNFEIDPPFFSFGFWFILGILTPLTLALAASYIKHNESFI